MLRETLLKSDSIKGFLIERSIILIIPRKCFMHETFYSTFPVFFAKVTVRFIYIL